MLITVKNRYLYRKWIVYYEKYYPEMIPAERRTIAFINSNNCEPIPFYVG